MLQKKTAHLIDHGGKRRNILGLSAIAAVGIAMLPISTFAQQQTLKQQLVETWLLVSAETTNADGTKFMPFGKNPKGTVVFDATGHFLSLNIDPTMPKFASNNRKTGTVDEDKAVVTMSIGLMGTYTVDETGKTILQHVDASTYPNWNGQDQKRPITSLTSDGLSYTTLAPSTGAGTTALVFKRAAAGAIN